MNMKVAKYISIVSFLFLLSANIYAQDAVIISPGNFVRGTIQQTDYKTVYIKTDEGTINQYIAKDIQEFLWNGETYLSKPFVNNNRTDYRFFKLIEDGGINLYTMGEKTSGVEKSKKKRIRFSPSIGIGIGSGGYRGFGMGGDISFGGGHRDDQLPIKHGHRPLIYISSAKSPETILEITPDEDLSEQNSAYIRNTLIQYMLPDKDIIERLKQTKSFDTKTIVSFVQAYNAVHAEQN